MPKRLFIELDQRLNIETIHAYRERKVLERQRERERERERKRMFLPIPVMHSSSANYLFFSFEEKCTKWKTFFALLTIPAEKQTIIVRPRGRSKSGNPIDHSSTLHPYMNSLNIYLCYMHDSQDGEANNKEHWNYIPPPCPIHGMWAGRMTIWVAVPKNICDLCI